MQLQMQSAIITGGASGMGLATAKMLSKQGVKVTLLDINENAAKEAAQDIGGLGLGCDVSDEHALAEAVEEATNRHGIARIAISCAGIAPAKRIVSKHGAMPLIEFKKVIDVNLVGTFNLMRVTAEKMMTLEPLEDTMERGVIINTASVAAYEGQIGQAAYSASKGGVVSFTLPAAREFAQFGIRVNTIAPGLIATPLLQSMPQEVQDSLAASVPFPSRLGHPDEFAKLALHIIDNEMINGETIRLDGAIRMQAR